MEKGKGRRGKRNERGERARKGRNKMEGEIRKREEQVKEME